MSEKALLEEGKMLIEFINETLPRMIIFNHVYRDKESISEIISLTPHELLELLPEALKELQDKGLILVNGDSVAKTEYGIKLYNTVFRTLIS